MQVNWITMNFVPFGEKALRMTVTLYQNAATDAIVMQKQVLHKIVQVSYFLFLAVL
jgi:hypothetical protein